MITPALIIHVTAGSLGILSGAAALSVRKGERLHRVFGTVFFVSMLTMSAMGAYLAFHKPDRLSMVTGVLTFYLVATAWMTVKRKESSLGQFEYGALLIVLGCAVADLIFGLQATNSPNGKLDGYPAIAYFIFASIAVLAAAFDLKVILRGGISGTPRVARHLWRMCLALFIAAASFFLGQQKVMPAFMHGSPILFVPTLAPLVLMIFWQIRVRLPNWFKSAGVARADRAFR